MAMQDIEGAGVLTTARHNDIRVRFSGLDELEIHRAYRVFILGKHGIQRSCPLLNVAAAPTYKTNIEGHIYEYLKIQQPSQLEIIQNQDALENDNSGWFK